MSELGRVWATLGQFQELIKIVGQQQGESIHSFFYLFNLCMEKARQYPWENNEDHEEKRWKSAKDAMDKQNATIKRMPLSRTYIKIKA